MLPDLQYQEPLIFHIQTKNKIYESVRYSTVRYP